MNSMRSYIDSNSAAISLLEEGQLNEAIATLKATLSHIRSQPDLAEAMGSGVEESVHHGIEPTEASGGAAAMNPTQSSPDSTIRSVPIQPRGFTLLADSYFTMFPKAFKIRNDVRVVDMQTIVSVLLYNLALSMHVFGAQNADQGLLSVAVCRQYEIALQMVLNCWDGAAASDFFVLLMATLNNLGCVQSQNQNLRECHDLLRVALDLIGCPPAHMDSSTREDFDFFYCHLSYLDPESLMSAPAA